MINEKLKMNAYIHIFWGGIKIFLFADSDSLKSCPISG